MFNMNNAKAKGKELIRLARSKATLPTENSSNKNTTSTNKSLNLEKEKLEEEKINLSLNELQLETSTDHTEPGTSVEKVKEKVNEHKGGLFNKLNNKEQGISLNPKAALLNKVNKEKGDKPMKLVDMKINENEDASKFEIPAVKESDKDKLMKRLATAKQMSKKKLSQQQDLAKKKSERILAMADIMQKRFEVSDYEGEIDKIIKTYDDKVTPPKKKFLLNDEDIQQIDDSEQNEI